MNASRARSISTRLLLLAASLAFAIVVAELLVAWIAPRAVLLVDRGLYLDDPPRGYRLNPGFVGRITNRVEYATTVKVNSEGLRGAELGARAAERPRLLVIGDSYAFGVGAEEGETLPVRLASHLAAEGVAVEALNGGVPGYGVTDAESWYRRWGEPLAPELVVLLVFAGNDLQDAMPGRRAAVIDGLLVVPGASPSGLSYWLFHHSHLYVMLKTSPAGDLARRLLGLPTPHERAELADELSLYALGEATAIERVGGAATEEAVARLAAALPPRRLVAALVPSDIAVDPEAWEKVLGAYGLDPATHEAGRLAGWFAALFERHGIPALDLTPGFAAAIARGERIYYPLDRHLTPAGYDLAAAEVARFLAPRLREPAGRPGA